MATAPPDTAFAQFTNHHHDVLPPAALNPYPVAQDDTDLTDPMLAYLTDHALPDPTKGCIIGVIDDAIPFVHERLRLANGASRIAAVWMQDARWRPDSPGQDLPSGIELRGAALTDLLQQHAGNEDAIYRMTGAIDLTHPITPSAAFAEGHGAAVALEAAGFAPDDEKARRYPVIAVSLPTRIIADSMGTLATTPLLMAILFIINRARRLCRLIEARRGPDAGPVKLPVVINISLGVTAGPRDGSSVLERFMDQVSQAASPDLGRVHFVLPSGNHRQARLRARLHPGQDIGWQVPPDDPTINAIEIWGPQVPLSQRGKMQITLTVPGMAPAKTALTVPWQYSVLHGPDNSPLARAYYTPHEITDGIWRDGITIIALPTCPRHLDEPFAPPGEWRIGIAADAPAGDYDLSIQRDEVIRGFRHEARQSWLQDTRYRRFDPSEWPVLTDKDNGGQPFVRRGGTVNAYGCGTMPVRAGAFYHKARSRFGDRTKTDDTLASDYCSHLMDGTGGDVMARVDQSLLHEYRVVRGQGSGSFVRASGTSVAAPMVTRWLATRLADGADFPDRNAIRQAAKATTAATAPDPILSKNMQFGPF